MVELRIKRVTLLYKIGDSPFVHRAVYPNHTELNRFLYGKQRIHCQQLIIDYEDTQEDIQTSCSRCEQSWKDLLLFED